MRLVAIVAATALLVACGGGVLRLLELQRPGGKRLPAKEFIKGMALETPANSAKVAK